MQNRRGVVHRTDKHCRDRVDDQGLCRSSAVDAYEPAGLRVLRPAQLALRSTAASASPTDRVLLTGAFAPLGRAHYRSAYLPRECGLADVLVGRLFGIERPHEAGRGLGVAETE